MIGEDVRGLKGDNFHTSSTFRIDEKVQSVEVVQIEEEMRSKGAILVSKKESDRAP